MHTVATTIFPTLGLNTASYTRLHGGDGAARQGDILGPCLGNVMWMKSRHAAQDTCAIPKPYAPCSSKAAYASTLSY